MEQQEAPMAGRPQQPFVHIKKETENKEVQTEAPPSGVIRVLNSKQRNRKVQVKLPASTAVWKKDPKTRTLHKMMKEAQQEAEQLREQTVPKERYEELQQQLRDISQSESQAFEVWQKEQEKVAKVTRWLDSVVKQMDTVCSLYNDVLTCRAPAKNYALFLLKRYLRLKIKAVRDRKSVV